VNGDGGLGGCLWAIVLGAMLVGFVVVGFGGVPNVSSIGLTWDNSGWINAQNQKTERERINANRDIRVAEEWNATMQIVGTTTLQVAAICVGLWAASKTIPAIFASIAAMFAAWAARPHRPQAPPQQIIVMAAPMLSAEPSATVEWVEEADYRGWALVNPRTQTLQPLQLTDSQRRR
jgi:hypothetical protein